MGTGSYLAGLAATAGTTGATTSGDLQQRDARGGDHAAAVGSAPPGSPAATSAAPGVPPATSWRQHAGTGRSRPAATSGRSTTSSGSPTRPSRRSGERQRRRHGQRPGRLPGRRRPLDAVRRHDPVQRHRPAGTLLRRVRHAGQRRRRAVAHRPRPPRRSQLVGPATATPVYLSRRPGTPTPCTASSTTAPTPPPTASTGRYVPGSTVALNLPGPAGRRDWPATPTRSTQPHRPPPSTASRRARRGPAEHLPGHLVLHGHRRRAAGRAGQLLRRDLDRDRRRRRHLGHRGLVPLRLPDAGRGRHGDRARHRAAEHRPLGQGRADDAGDDRSGLAVLRGLRHAGQRDRGAVARRPGRRLSSQLADHRHGARLPDGRPVHPGGRRLLHRLHLAGRQHLDGDPRLDPGARHDRAAAGRARDHLAQPGHRAARSRSTRSRSAPPSCRRPASARAPGPARTSARSRRDPAARPCRAAPGT